MKKNAFTCYGCQRNKNELVPKSSTLDPAALVLLLLICKYKQENIGPTENKH